MEDTIREIGLKCLKKAKGNWDRACKFMQEEADEDRVIFDAIARPLLGVGIRTIIMGLARQQRSYMWDHVREIAPQNDREALADIAADNWLEYSLAGGKPLGAATWLDLDHEAASFETLARTNATRAKFFRMIQKKLERADPKRQKKVRDVLKDGDIEQIYEECGGAQNIKVIRKIRKAS